MGEFQLDEHEAFRAMTLFIDQFVELAGDDLLTLIGDITADESTITADPAAWDDWKDCVRQVIGERCEA